MDSEDRFGSFAEGDLERRWGATKPLSAELRHMQSTASLPGNISSYTLMSSASGQLGMTSTSSMSSFGLRRKRPGGGSGVWRSSGDQVPSPLPPLAKGALRHRIPTVDKKTSKAEAVVAERVLVDWDAADSYGRRETQRANEKQGVRDGKWYSKVFEVADGSLSGYLSPAEFAAMASRMRQTLRTPMDGFKGGFKFDFTYVDSNMEGRINIAEFEEFCRQCEKQWGPERCSRAASRYIGTRQAELRTNAKTSFQKRATMSMFDGFDAEASHRLLMCCSPKEVENNASSLVESVQACLEQGADPNVFLLDKVHDGFTPLIFLAMTRPTVDSGQVGEAIDVLIEAKGDVQRESGLGTFGRLVPLQFAAQMQNRSGLDALLRNIDVSDRFHWAAGENVEHVMLEEVRKKFGDRTRDKVLKLSRYNARATVVLRLFASKLLGSGLSPLGAKQLLTGEFGIMKGWKADPDGPGLEGMTALMQVVRMGERCLDTTKALLDGGASPNQKDSSGATPLHFAASKMEPKVAQALLDAGAEKCAVDHMGLSAWMLIGEDVCHKQEPPDMKFVERKDGKFGDAQKRDDLLEMLRPKLTPEEILWRLEDEREPGSKEPWTPAGALRLLEEFGSDPEVLMKELRLHESLFFNPRIITRGGYQGRNVQNQYLQRVGDLLIKLIRTDPLTGKLKNLCKYLLLASIGPDSKKAGAHVHQRWQVDDNRDFYREDLMDAVRDMLDNQFGTSCGRLRKAIMKAAKDEPEGPCALLRELPADVVNVPQKWQDGSAFWKAVQDTQVLRYDPSWAVEAESDPTRCAVALLRLGAVDDLAQVSALQQVNHAPMEEMLGRGYIKFSEICNEAFQTRMMEVVTQVAEQEGLQVDPPNTFVQTKKLKRLMEKTREARAERGDMQWPGLPEAHVKHGYCFHILDTVRMSFTCGGETTADQVACCMKILHKFGALDPERDGIALLRQKSGFAHGVKATGGYADVKLLCYADLGEHQCFDGTKIPMKIVGEIQLILEDYMEVKHRMHLAYEVNRGSFDLTRPL